MPQINIIEGPYLLDIHQQPEALRQSVAGFAESPALARFAGLAAAGEFQRIILTGMGSSLFALYPLHLTLSETGLPSLLIETAELIHYLPRTLQQKALVIAVSQSGQSAEIVRLLALAQGRVPVIAITNNPDSVLAREAAAYVLIHAGVEATVSCKTYVATLAALEWLAAIFQGASLIQTRERLNLAAPAVESYLQHWRQHVAELAGVLTDVRQLFVTGRGPSLATALTGGLILKESARFPSEGMSCAAFRHGPYEMLAPQILVLILAGDQRAQALNRKLAADIGQQTQGKAAIIDTTATSAAFQLPAVPDALRPIVEILPVQMVSLALAALSSREAGHFDLATKVTAVE